MPEFCKNCGHTITDHFCSHCGQKTATARFTIGHLFHEFIHGFYHFDHGLLFTAKELAIRPGKTIRNYLEGKRIRYFNPFTFILLLGGINALLLKRLHWQNFFIDMGVLQSSDINQEIWNSAVEHFAIRLLLSIPVYAVVTFCIYYRKKNTLAEHIIANTFVRGELNLFMILVEPLMFISINQNNLIIFKGSIFLVFIVYIGWCYAGIFHKQVLVKDIFIGILAAIVASLLDLTLLNLIISKRLFV